MYSFFLAFNKLHQCSYNVNQVIVLTDEQPLTLINNARIFMTGIFIDLRVVIDLIDSSIMGRTAAWIINHLMSQNWWDESLADHNLVTGEDKQQDDINRYFASRMWLLLLRYTITMSGALQPTLIWLWLRMSLHDMGAHFGECIGSHRRYRRQVKNQIRMGKLLRNF
jgi:hypothetical protein